MSDLRDLRIAPQKNLQMPIRTSLIVAMQDPNDGLAAPQRLPFPLPEGQYEVADDVKGLGAIRVVEKEGELTA